jgi:hypothetical protein
MVLLLKRGTKRVTKKISKAKLCNYYRSFMGLTADDTSNKQSATLEFIFHSLVPFVPWIFLLDNPDYVCIGEVGMCRELLAKFYNTANKLEVSKRDVKKVLEETYLQPLSEDEGNKLYSLLKEDISLRENQGSWSLKVFASLNGYVMPMLVKLAREEVLLLAKQQEIDWEEQADFFPSAWIECEDTDREGQWFKNCARAIMAQHAEQESRFEEEALQRMSKVVLSHDKDSIDWDNLACSQLRTCKAALIPGMNMPFVWEPVLLDKDGKARHNKNWAYLVELIPKEETTESEEEETMVSPQQHQQSQEEPCSATV